jgi:hypothetical protein
VQPSFIEQDHLMPTIHRSAASRTHMTSYMVFGLLCSGALVCQAEASFSFATLPG